MKKNFAQITFTDSVKKVQKKFGSRTICEKMESRPPDQADLYHREMGHIAELDGFYMSTVNEDGWPYVQFRGGPKGFLKVLDQQTIGFADFKGNMQYISTGNINAKKKTALILMHYPTKRRLKIWAETEILDPSEHPDLAKKIINQEYGAIVERLIIFHIVAYDWNCPQHIPQRYTIEEFKSLAHSDPTLFEECKPK